MKVYRLGPELKKCKEQPNDGVSVITLKFGENCSQLEKAGISDLAERTQEDIAFCNAEAHHMYIEGSLCIPNPENICGKRTRMVFFLTKDCLAFVDDGSVIEHVLERARMNPKDLVQSREKLLYDFFSLLIDRDPAMLRKLEAAILQMEDEVDEGTCKDFRERAQTMRRELLILREYYSGLSDVAEELEENDNGICDEENLNYFGIISSRADRLESRTNRLLEFLAQVQTAHNEMLMEVQNRNMNYLSVISTIFLPLTLITGWFGMNFQNMPELENGYPWVIGGSLIIVILVVLLFKKKKML